MASLGDSASMFGDPRAASQFATMRQNQRVFSDPAIANHSNHATSSQFITRDDQTCHSVPVTPRKAVSQNQISRMPPPPTNNRYSSTLLGNFLTQNRYSSKLQGNFLRHNRYSSTLLDNFLRQNSQGLKYTC